jgi:hypothetical protein
MLRVQHSGVNPVARTFQDAGIIRYARGELTILDRAALEARTCMCYGVINNEFRRRLRDLKSRQSSERGCYATHA